MKSALEKEWKKLLKREERYFLAAEKREERNKDGIIREWTDKIQDKIPEKLIGGLNIAFYKAFFLIFEKGGVVIQKTFRKEETALEFRVNDYRVSQSPTKKALQQVDSISKKSSIINSCVTTVEGVGLGVLGIGLPDIPIFLGMLLKGVYETATGYGYAYKDKREQIFILRMIYAALAKGAEKREADRRVEQWRHHIGDESIGFSFEEEVRFASEALSGAMLTSKFIQGFFVVGAIGGVANPIIYRQVMEYISMKYKKRYLTEKQLCE